ncbi:MAG: MFS transporter, partial [Lactobacillus sp.]|nr:MFS transporter [Lactobacillus sp.]
GYQHTYVMMGIFVFVITLFSAFALKKEDPVQAGEVAESNASSSTQSSSNKNK